MNDKEKRLTKSISKLGSIAEQVFNLGANAVSDPVEAVNISDYYESKGEIARGGIKTIDKVMDKKTGRYVAMAKLIPELRTSSNVERFLREARTLASLEHPNIVPLYEIAYDKDSIPFFTMKLLSGSTLGELLKIERENRDKKGNITRRYSTEYLLDIFIKVCDAVAYAHSKSIIHLDLKPANIQISEFGEVLVLDWGLAKKLGEPDDIDPETISMYTPISSNITQMGSISGTPGYMSPEQCSSERRSFSEASDIYSLGVILYHILTLEEPGKSKSVEEIINHKNEGLPLEFPKSISGKPVPFSIKSVAQRAMAFKEDERYPTATAMQEDVKAYLQGSATRAENPSPLTILFLFIKRKRKIISIISSAVLVIALLSSVFYQHAKKQEIIIQQVEYKAKNSEENLNHALQRENFSSYIIIQGAEEEETEHRQKYRFDHAINLYDRLIDFGHKHPYFWFRKAKLHAGELHFKEALDALEIAEADKSLAFLKMESYINFSEQMNKYYVKSQAGPISEKELYGLVTHMSDPLSKEHIVYTLNHRPEITLKEKLLRLPDFLAFLNSDIRKQDINIEYQIQDGRVSLDLSGNYNLYNIQPIIGLPIEKLNISNCKQLNIDNVFNYLGTQCLELNISDSNIYLSGEPHLKYSKYKKIIAKRIALHSSDWTENLEYLDLEGASIKFRNLYPMGKLQYLNIAHSNFKDYAQLPNRFPKLKTLVVDKSMVLPKGVKEKLKARGVEIEEKSKI